MREKILITGLGVVSPLGQSIETYWQSLLYGQSVPASYSSLPIQLIPNTLYYGVSDWKCPIPWVSGINPGRASQFAIYAAHCALTDAGLLNNAALTSMGVSIGTAMGDYGLLEQAKLGEACVLPSDYFFFKASACVATHFDCTGPNLTASTACAAGAYAISMAVDMLHNGIANVMIAGGTDAYNRVGQACFNRLGAFDPVVCRPFSAERAGTLGGEGAAILVLEKESHFYARGGCHYYAEIKGYGLSCDGHHITAPDPKGTHAEKALQRALHDAQLVPQNIDAIVAHGTGTVLNDEAEASVIQKVFSSGKNEPLICAIKSKLGHSGGAAGAFSCLTAALMVKHNIVPPVANLDNKDPRCEINLTTEEPVSMRLQNVLLSAYAFGGNNISIVIGKGDGNGVG